MEKSNRKCYQGKPREGLRWRVDADGSSCGLLKDLGYWHIFCWFSAIFFPSQIKTFTGRLRRLNTWGVLANATCQLLQCCCCWISHSIRSYIKISGGVSYVGVSTGVLHIRLVSQHWDCEFAWGRSDVVRGEHGVSLRQVEVAYVLGWSHNKSE